MIPFPILKLLPAGNRVAVLINKIRLLTVSPELMWIVSYPFVIGKSIFFLNIKFLIFAIADPDGGKISIKFIEESGAIETGDSVHRSQVLPASVGLSEKRFVPSPRPVTVNDSSKACESSWEHIHRGENPIFS